MPKLLLLTDYKEIVIAWLLDPIYFTDNLIPQSLRLEDCFEDRYKDYYHLENY